VEQLVIVLTPVIAQLPAGVGATALSGPETVAVKVIVAPSAAVEEFAATLTVGLTATTVVEAPEVGDVAK
jgi:hypothetical protein